VSAPNDPGFWREIISVFVALITAMFSWMFKDVHDRIKEVKMVADAKLSKDDFDTHLVRSLEERKNLRDDVKELFNRDDKMKDMLNDKFDTIRKEFHDGFERLSREIRSREGRT